MSQLKFGQGAFEGHELHSWFLLLCKPIRCSAMITCIPVRVASHQAIRNNASFQRRQVDNVLRTISSFCFVINNWRNRESSFYLGKILKSKFKDFLVSFSYCPCNVSLLSWELVITASYYWLTFRPRLLFPADIVHYLFNVNNKSLIF